MKFYDEAELTEGGIIDSHERFKVEVKTDEEKKTGKKYDCFRITTKQAYGGNE